MKKILLFFVALFACASSAWAQTVVTDPATQMVDGVYITLQCMDTNGGDGYYFNGADAKSPALQVSNFYKIISNDGDAFYLQCVSSGKYVGNSNNLATLVDETSNANTFTFSIATATSWSTPGATADNGKNTVRFTTTTATGSNTYLNTNEKANTPKYATGEGGFSIWLVKTYTEAEVKSPSFSGNYVFKNNRSTKYACWAGDDTQISQSSTVNLAAVWTITPNSDGSFKLGNKATSNYYNSTTSFTAEGKSVYFGLSAKHTACLNISETSTFNNGTCWDDQDYSTHVGYWNANDEGTSWILEAVSDDDVLTYSYNYVLAKANEAYYSLQYKGEDLNTSNCTFDNTCGDSDEGTTPGNLIDGNASTYWHTDWHSSTSENPHWIAIEYPEALNVGTYQLTIVRRQAQSDHVKEFTIYGKNDGDWEQIAIVELPFNASGETKTAVFDLNASYKSLKYAATKTTNNRTYWHAAELQLNKVVTNRSLASEAATTLKEMIDGATKSQEYIDELQTAINAYNAAIVNSYTPSIPEDKYFKIGAKANSVTAATSGSDNSHWFLMTQVREGETPMYDNGVGNTIMRAAASVTPASLQGVVATDNKKYLVRFFETTPGVYNIQFGTGNFIQTTVTTGTFANAGKYFVYNINDENTHIGWNLTTDGTTYGSIVDNNAAGNSVAFWSTGKITATGGNNDWSIYPVEFADPATIEFTLTNELEEQYRGTYSTPWSGDNTATPTFASAAGATISGATFTENNGTYSMTGTITFPFPISNATTQNATGIQSELGSSKWYAKDGNVVADNADNTNITYANQDNYKWYIYPSFSEGIFTFKLYNVAAEKYIATSATATSANTTNALVEAADAGSFCFMACTGTGNGFATSSDGSIFLTVNTSGTNQNIWYWTKSGAHKGSNLTFPDVTITEEQVNTQFAALKGATMFDIVEGATLMGPSEFANPVEINAAIEAAQNVEENVTAKAEFVNGENGQKIQNYLNQVAKYGSLSNVSFELKAQYGTLILPCPSVKFDDALLKMYTCSAVDGTNVTLDKNEDNFAYHTPYIIEKVGDQAKFQIIGWDKSSELKDEKAEGVITVGCLTGVLKGGKTIPNGSYILAKKNNVLGFYQVEEDINKEAALYKCYLTVSSSESSKAAFYFPGEGTVTSIEEIFGGEENNGTVYDLQGRRVNNATHGIYIINGKKVLK